MENISTGSVESNDIVEIRKQKIINFFKNKSWAFYLIIGLILAALIYVNVDIRSSNMSGLKDITTGNWTLGPDLDPFLFLRYAKYIVEHGSLMTNDTMRYVPFGYNTAGETMLLPYSIAWLYNIVKIFKSDATVDYAGVIYPVIMSIFTAIFFFLFVNKIFEGKGKKTSAIIALIATAFFILIPSLLPRTIAGIPEKEAASFFFIFIAFYFFLEAITSKNLKKGSIEEILKIKNQKINIIYVGYVNWNDRDCVTLIILEYCKLEQGLVYG